MPLALLAALAALAAPSPATPSLVRHASLALDPWATRIATVDSVWVQDQPVAGHGVVAVRDTRGKAIGRYDPCGTCGYEGLAWSPDGNWLAFVASGGGTATLYVLEKGISRKVTSIAGLASTPRWSADGQTIAFLATEGAHKMTGATQPGVRQVGLIGTTDDSRRIAIVPATGGAYRLVSPEGTFVYEFGWTPDGKGFVGTAAEGNGDNQWWVASLRAFPIDGAMRVIAAPKLQMNDPRVSPDGKSIAFIGGLMSDFGSIGGDIYVVPFAGGEPRNLTPGYRATFNAIEWRGGKIIAGLIQSGSEGTAIVDPAGGVSAVSVAPASISTNDGAVALDRSGAHAATVAESFTAAPRITFGPLGRMRTVVDENAALRAGVVAHDVRWRRSGTEYQGWLIEPASGSAASQAKQPMITVIHGGPAAATTPRFAWTGSNKDLLAHGYWLFQPNPRGSYGYGEAVVRANVQDFGGEDLADILAGIDQVEKQAPIDDARLGVFGHSYGGYMTMWTVTHSQRFKAAVAGAGIADWVAYYGQNGIDQWMVPYFGATAYDDPTVYDRLSPIRYIKAVKTPTFLYVGERDVECPPAQSLEYWHGLRAMGVPTELMIYADEGHGIRQPKNIADLTSRLVGWFDKYLAVR